jgi:hypothetical protein
MNGVIGNLRLLLALGVLGFSLTLTGCQTGVQPHVTAKVIFQQDDVAAELSTEWH